MDGLAARLAKLIEDDIMQQGWPVGKIIGSEEQLCAHHGVGRNVFREAVRILETHGVARRRQGPGGGLMVVAPDADVLLDSARLFMNYRGARLAHIYDAWVSLEGLAIDGVLRDLTPLGLMTLREIIVQEEKWDAQTRSSTIGRPNVHLEIARLSGNPVVELFLQTVFTIALDRGVPRMPDAEATWLRGANASLVDAIATGDAGLAHRHLRQIVDMIADSNDVHVDAIAGAPQLSSPRSAEPPL